MPWLLASRTALAQALPSTLILGRVDLLTDGPLVAIAERLRAELSSRTGIMLELRVLPALRTADMANTGLIDGDLGRIADLTLLYPNLMIVPTRVAKAVLAMYVSTPDMVNAARGDFKGRSVAMMRGIASTAKNGGGMRVFESNSYETVFEMLKTGRVQAALLMYTDAASYLRSHPEPGIYRWHSAWAEAPLYLLLNRKYAPIVPKFNKALIDMKREGLLDRIYDDALRQFGVEPLVMDERR